MEASTAVSSRLIGAFFVEKGLVTQEQLDVALKKQEESGERLGEIIVAEFGVSRLELASVLAEQWAELERENKTRAEEGAATAPVATASAGSDEPEPADLAEPQLRRPIGEIFLERGFVSRDDLDRALEAQRETGTRLGEVLVEQGSLSRLDLASALAEQWSALQKLRPPDPVEPQPWQNSAPDPATASTEISGDLRSALESLAERVTAVERAASGTPWNEDLRLLGDNVRAALATVEERVGKAAARIDPAKLDALGAALDELQERVGEPSARLDAVERRLGDLPSAETLDERLAELSDEAVSANDLAALRGRVDELGLRMVVPEALAEVRAEVAAYVREAPTRAELDLLRGQVEAAGAGSVPAERVAELQARVSELEARAVGSETLEALRARVDELGSAAGRSGEMEALQARVEELASVRSLVDGLAGRVADAEDLAALRGRVDELGLRMVVPEALAEVRERVAGLAEQVATGPAVPPELVERIESLARESAAAREQVVSLTSDLSGLAKLGPRMEELAAQLPAERQALAELRHALEELAARAATDVPREEVDRRIGELVGRLDELGDRVQSIDTRNVEPSGPRLREILDGLRVEIDAVAARPVVDVDGLEGRLADVERLGTDSIDALAASVEGQRAHLEARLDELSAHLPEPRVLEELRAEITRVRDAEAADRAELAHTLGARIEELTSIAPSVQDVADLQARFDRLASESTGEGGLRERMENLAGRIDEAFAVLGAQDELRYAVSRLESAQAEESGILAERLAGIDGALGALAGVEWRLQTQLEESLAVRASELEHRVADTQQRLDALAELEGTVEALSAERLARLREDVATRADEMDARLRELPGREEMRETIAQQAAALAADLAEIRRVGSEREQALTEALAGLVDRATVEQLEMRLAEHDARLADPALSEKVDAVAGELRDRSAAIEQTVGAAHEELERVRNETEARVDEMATTLRNETEGRTVELEERLSAREAELAALQARVDAIDAAAAAQVEWRDQLERSVGARTTELAAEGASLAARVDELLGLRHQDLRAARKASEALRARVDELTARQAESAEAAHAATGELTVQMQELTVSLRNESAAARTTARQVEARMDALESTRADDIESARVAGAELVARLDDLAIRTAAAAAEADRALRSELYTLAATFEEKDAAEIEARDELRLEVERAASSFGWRLERIEEALASEDGERLRETVAELERRLERQSAQQEEQVRVTERALRKGLASLGERLAGTQTAYLDAGNALRRSIERLGAAVVEADARMADQIPVAAVEGYVAFAPTGDGYRLVEVPGSAPQVGDTVEVAGVDGPLVVTRVGRSPLPLDSRPCAYLDRP